MSNINIKSLLKIIVEANGTTDSHFNQVKFYSGNEKFIATTNDGDIYEGNVSTRKIRKIHVLNVKCTALLILDEDSNICIFGLESGIILKFDNDLKNETGSHPGVGEAAVYLSKHPHSDRVLATLKFSAIIWDISQASPVPLQRLNTFDSIPLKRAFFNHNGDTAITCFVDGNIFTWDFPILKFHYHLDTRTTDMVQMATSEDLQTLIIVDREAEFSIWDLPSLSNRQIFCVTEINEEVTQLELTTVINRSSETITVAVVLTISGGLFFVDMQRYVLLYKHQDRISDKIIKFHVGSYSSGIRKHPLAFIINDGNLEILDMKRLHKKAAERKPPATANTSTTRDIVVQEKPTQPEKKGGKMKKVAKQSIGIEELRKTLETFGEFPARYRAVVWRNVLGLPLNKQAFTTLVSRGLHPAYSNLEQRFPITDETLLRNFRTILSAFAHWCPLFAEVVYFPLMIFPFVRVLQENVLVCFEVIMTYLVNWCYDWFRIYPAPPFESMAKVEGLMEKFCPEVLAHFTKYDVSMRVYAWPLLESSFSDVFTTDEWSCVWDHIFTSRDVDFLYAVVAAYSLVSQNSLLRCTDAADFQRYFHEKNPVPVESVLREAKQMLKESVSRKKGQFVFLTELTYPLFSDFPLAVIENHACYMNKIREMEADYIKQKKESAVLEAEFGRLHEIDTDWRRKEAMLKAVEDLREQEVITEERKLKEQRLRLQMQRKCLLEQELKIMESKKRSLQREYIHWRKEDVLRMKDSARWIATIRETELQDAAHSEDIRNYQMQMENCIYEIKLLENEIIYKSKTQNDSGNVNAVVDERINYNQTDNNEVLDSDSQSSVLNEDDNLSEKLKQLEISNKEIESEIKKFIQNLERMS